MRLAFVLAACAAALITSASASAAFLPVHPGGDPPSRSTVRPGNELPSAIARLETVSVILRLRTAPLAATRGLLRARAASRAGLRSPQAARHLSAIAREQVAARVELAQVAPRARVTAEHRVLLNALVVDVPLGDLTRVNGLRSVEGVYPSLTYRPLVDRGRAVIGAEALEAVTGDTGAGVKIAIVDDGIDVSNPFFSARGLAYPPGFPKGAKGHVSEKVIVARSFTTSTAGRAARRPFDRTVSFHGNHVAGIAAGVPTAVAAGTDHPRVAQVRGVAPASQLGNYRVFNEPSPVGNVATSSQLVAAFEAAVLDGMDVINFSGGTVEIDHDRDVLIEAVTNATRAGVVVVVAAGNRRDQLGAGSVSSPAVAPEAIAVGAVTSDRVFAPALSLSDAGAPTELIGVPYATPFGVPLPRRLTRSTARLHAVESIVGLRGTPVHAELCSPRGNPNGRPSELPAGSLKGSIAIVSRGTCTIASKVDRARRAGAIGVVLVDNRAGEPAAPPGLFSLPLLVISDLDGRRLAEHALAARGAVDVRLGRGPAGLIADRDGVVSSFSSVGPTAFGHHLKPDVSAPGVSILSASNAALTGSPFGVLSGTSMAAPHIAGTAALLLEQHPEWEPWQLKSALATTAAPAWLDTARTSQAPPTVGGAGLVAAAEAANPLLFTLPASLSLGDIRTRTSGPATEAAGFLVSDAGGGAGEWTLQADVTELPQGASVDVAPTAVVPANDSTTAWLTVTVQPETQSGPLQGTLRLTRNGITRAIPFYGFVSNPKLASHSVSTLRTKARGSTADAASTVEEYGFPTAPLGPPATPGGKALNETGGETVFRFDLAQPAINAGVAVIPQRRGVVADPFILGSLDEHAVLGLPAMPVTANGALASSGQRDGAAAVLFPKAGRYWVVVDSGVDTFTRSNLAGSYRIRRWANDLQPPRLELLTRRVARGRGTVAVRALDAKSGVDPLTITLFYGNFELSASVYDYESGVALFRIPRALPRLPRGVTRVALRASDHQEAKNVHASDTGFLTNTAIVTATIRVDESVPHITWLLPSSSGCTPAGGRMELSVTAAGSARVKSVRFDVGGRLVALDRKPRFGDVFEATWSVPTTAQGRVRLLAEATLVTGEKQRRVTRVRICRTSR